MQQHVCGLGERATGAGPAAAPAHRDRRGDASGELLTVPTTASSATGVRLCEGCGTPALTPKDRFCATCGRQLPLPLTGGGSEPRPGPGSASTPPRPGLASQGTRGPAGGAVATRRGAPAAGAGRVDRRDRGRARDRLRRRGGGGHPRRQQRGRCQPDRCLGQRSNDRYGDHSWSMSRSRTSSAASASFRAWRSRSPWRWPRSPCSIS